MKVLKTVSFFLLCAGLWLNALADARDTHRTPKTRRGASKGTNAPAVDADKKKKETNLVAVARPSASIIRGPYLQCGTTNSMVVRWRSDIQGPSQVRYGTSPTNLNKKANSSGTLTEHVVLIKDLKPDTKYYYAVGAPDTPIIAAVSNKVVRLESTNSSLAIQTKDRVRLTSVTNGALFLLLNKRRDTLLISNPATRMVINSSNTYLVASTTNNTLTVWITNRALHVSTTNQTHPLQLTADAARKRPGRIFSVGITNLTTLGGDEATWFMTHPAIGSKPPVRAWVIGDPGTRKVEQRRVRDAYAKFTGSRHTDLWLTVGDNAYSTGTDVEYHGAIFQMYPEMLARSVLWPSLGNHDAGSADSPTQSGVYYDIFTLPTQGQAGGVMSGTEAYYSYDYGNVHFVCIDSANSDRSTNGAMYQWLKADLAANKQDWCVAYCHHPPYTKGSHDSDKEKDSSGIMLDMQAIIVPLLEEGGVDLFLTGHSHAYERSYLLDGLYKRSSSFEEEKNVKDPSDGRIDGAGAYYKPTLGPAPHEGTMYIVAGSSGQTSGGGLLHPAMYASLNVLGSVVLDFHGSRMDVSFIDTNAIVRDYFTMVKGPEYRPREQKAEPVKPLAGLSVPERVARWVESSDEVKPELAAYAVSTEDEELLLRVYHSTSNLTQKSRITWALATSGDTEAVTNFMRLLTTEKKGKTLTLEEEDLSIETVHAMGFLATRYEAAYEFLKKAANSSYWATNAYWISPRGSNALALLVANAIRGIGISGRPEAVLFLQEWAKDTKRMEVAGSDVKTEVARALENQRRAAQLGPIRFQNRYLRDELSRPRLKASVW